MNNVTRRIRTDHQRNVIDMFHRLCFKHARWEVWSDFVVMSAISLSNTVDKSNAEAREKNYMTIASKYSKAELETFSSMFAEIVCGMDREPDQDFLGELFMALELGNDHKGQFFTPYCVCAMMAQITGADLKNKLNSRPWFSVNDCACGAGALLIAFANECVRQKINYQTTILFVAQDIDLVAGLMCYIQLSLLGCAGYVVIANTITNPSVSVDQYGLIPKHGENVWYAPFYFRDIWHYRRIGVQMDMLFQPCLSKVEPETITTNEAASDSGAEPNLNEPEQVIHLNANKFGQLTLF